jgi:hypothetical protein
MTGTIHLKQNEIHYFESSNKNQASGCAGNRKMHKDTDNFLVYGTQLNNYKETKLQ